MKRYDYKNSRVYDSKRNRELSKGDVVRHFIIDMTLVVRSCEETGSEWVCECLCLQSAEKSREGKLYNFSSGVLDTIAEVGRG